MSLRLKIQEDEVSEDSQSRLKLNMIFIECDKTREMRHRLKKIMHVFLRNFNFFKRERIDRFLRSK